ncbi:ATP-binding cassette domain-containing protein [Brevibacterium yomogidense]|uniref:ATP-binding cassette domain-containing protein n=1 Tax=Brevibacterium yomogidense TaxID=946573 RepID=UPI0018E05ECB|nr:dipeptide/oligopeptide/nickel ABC transporter ATP-binding protein [Brevibacterium yomogidense]
MSVAPTAPADVKTNGAEPIIRARNVSVDFKIKRNKTVTAVSDVSIDVTPRSSIGLIGESGSGKSTLARALLGLVPVTSGSVEWEGHDISKLSAAQMRRFRTTAQMVFQDPHSALDPRRRILTSIIEPLKVLGIGTKADRQNRAEEMLSLVGLRMDQANRFPHQLSGGQKQRACIARALIVEPKILVCDESVAALDVALQAEILNLLSDLRDSLDLALVFISHDLSVVAHISDRMHVMYLGETVEEGSMEQITSAPEHEYTKKLLASQLTVDGAQTAREDSAAEAEVHS